MEAVVKQHPQKGKGWAVITLSGDGVPAGGLKFQLRRPTGRDAILGPTGWQATELWLSAAEATPVAGGMALTVGPEVVNHMDTANYALLVQGDGVSAKQPLQAGLAWRNIAQLDLGAGKRGGVAVRGEVDEAAAARARAAAQAQAQAQADADRAAAEKAAADKAAREAAEKAALDKGGQRTSGGDDEKKGGKGGLIAAALAALLVVGGGAAWFLWPKPVPPVAEDDAARKKQADGEKKPEDKKPEETRKVELPKAPETDDDLPAGADPLKFARDKLQAGIDAGPSAKLADKLMQRPPQGIDAAYLLYRNAAQKGDAAAALKLARIVDPADETPSGSLKKSADSAFDWYRQAEQGQQADATPALAKLKAWAEKQAGTGDAEAARVLKRFQ